MQTRRRLRFYWLVLSLLLAACAATPLRAQTPDQNFDDEDEKSASTLSVTVNLSEDGKAVVAAYAYTREPRDLKPALEAAFHCALASKSQQTPSYFFGACTLPVTRAHLLHQYRISTRPLLEYAQQNGADLLQIQLTLPETQVRDTVPRVQAMTFPKKQLDANLIKQLAALRVFAWRTNDAIPEFVEIRVGYASAAIRRGALLLLSALLAPIGFALWLRRRALVAQAPDRSSVWFSYLRYQSWLLNGSLIVWWGATETTQLDALTRFFSDSHDTRLGWTVDLTSSLLTWIPPVLVWIICVLISQPVQEKLRGLAWTRKELVLQALYSLSSALLPLLLSIKGIGAIVRGGFRAGVLWIIAGVVVKFVAHAKLLKALGMQPEALTTGDLRDTAFAVAERLGVKLQQIYVISAGKGQMANAFARNGNTIAFTDYLLQRMSRREVNYILGHELSHLRLKHLQKLSYVFVGSLSAGVFLITTFRSTLPAAPFFRFGLLFALMTVLPYFWSRRFEFSADAGAVEATGDPEGAISALFKLASLNMHPLHWSKWSEKWLTHPSTLRRAQAIARKASIPMERLPEIARNAMQTDTHYEVPASAIAGNKVLSTAKKTSSTVQSLVSMLSAIILTPTAVAVFIKLAHLGSGVEQLLYVAGFFAALLAYLGACIFVPVRKLREVIPQLKTKAESEGVQADGWNGVSVGLAPGAMPRIYEGQAQWDLGFLFLRSDRICYWGEETRFALRRDQITGIKLGPSMPNLLRIPRVYIAWRDAERSTCGVFSVACASPETLLTLSKRTKNLFGQLLQWHATPTPVRTLPVPLDSLVSPQFGNVTGTSAITLRQRERILKQLYIFGMLAAGIAVVAGLPFHLFESLFRGQSARYAQPGSLGAGWYVVGVTLAIIVLQYVPYFFYKDVPVLEAGSVGSGRASDSVKEGAEESREPETVSR